MSERHADRRRLPRLPGLLATALLVGASSTPLAAQELAVGTWTGTMVPPEGISAPVAFEVVDDEGLAITMTVEGTTPRPLETIVLNGDLLTFSFVMGSDVRCELERQPDGSFTGPCASGDMRMGTLTMVPPGG